MATVPPYPPGTLKAPLTADQKAAVLAYLKPVMDHPGADPTFAVFSGYSDGGIINEYNFVASKGKVLTGDPGAVTPGVGPVSIPNPIHTVEQFISAITNPNLWLRVAEFGVGSILLAVGLNAVLRPGKSLPIPKVIPL